MNVLFNADDFGLTKGITDGTIIAHEAGIIQSTTLLMNGLATNYAIERAKEYPLLYVGIHLVLTWGRPILKQMNRLTDENGLFRFAKEVTHFDSDTIMQIRQEWIAQIELYLQSGLPLHHIDSHHHVHGLDCLRELVIELAEMYKVPVRYVDSLRDRKDLLLTETTWLHFYDKGVNNQLFSELKAIPYSSVEVMTHPAIIDPQLSEVTSYVQMREIELHTLIHLEVPRWVKLYTH